MYIQDLKVNNIEEIANAKIDEKGSKTITSFPQDDKLWEQYYNEVPVRFDMPKRTVYQEIYEMNKDYPRNLALEYFLSHIYFGNLFDHIDSTAKSFEEYGVQKGDFVTICCAGIPETVYSFYALSKIGAVSNSIAPHFDKNDLIERIYDCESDILIVMDNFYDEIKEAIKKSRIKHVIVVPTLNSSILGLMAKKYKLDKHSNELYWNQFIKDGKHRENTETVGYEENYPLAMVYSSGTEGASKGILLSNDSFQNSVHAYLDSGIRISRNEKLYQIIPPWYSTGLSTSIHLPLSCGSAVFMDPRFERDIFVKNILKYKPNFAIAPTSMYEGFLEEDLVKNADLSFLDCPFEGGEPLPKEVGDKINDVFKDHGSNAKLLVGYGQCECGATVTTETSKTAHTNGSVGIPLPGINLGIYDDEFNKLSYNERGNILVDTPSSMLGYYENDEANKKYFYVDENGKKWNCTGDLGYIDELGKLIYCGRASDYTIVNNRKIYNFDVENIIIALPEIKMCDCLSKSDGESSALALHIVFDDNFDKDIADNQAKLYEELQKIQNLIYENTNDEDMVPEIFKIRHSFPYAKSGKRNIQELKKETDGFINLNWQKPKVKKISK
jgi:long-chain acyl-CoA synthetase